MIKRSLIFGALVMLMLGGCVGQTPAASPSPIQEPQVLTVMTHDSFAVSAELVQQFETENNVKVNFIKGGDAGTTLNRLILTSLGGTPEAESFAGDNTFLCVRSNKIY